MLEKFSKLTLCVTSTIALTSVYSNEYIIDNYSNDNKEQLYSIVSKFRFPSILSKFMQEEFRVKYPDYDLIDTFRTKETEYEFLKSEINGIDEDAKITAVPKSLYQFMTYDYFDSTISVPKDYTGRTLYKNLTDQKKKFDLRSHAKENEEWGLTRACSHFMANEEIKDIFWKVNEHAKNLYRKHDGKTEKIIHEIFEAYRADNNSRKGLLDNWNLDQQRSITHRMHAKISRIETMVGKTSEWTIPEGWSEEKRQELKLYTTNCILSEDENPNYVLYHGGDLRNPNSEMANRKSICFSDGLFSGYIFDPGASAYVYSVPPSNLWQLGLDREKLLKDEYPIFIPPAFHLLSGAGNGELFHARTKVVQAVIDDETKCIDNETKCIDNYALSIKSLIKPLVAGFKLNETPEFYTTQNPQILLKKHDEHYNNVYEITNQGVFDKAGAEKLEAMLKTIQEVPEREITLR